MKLKFEFEQEYLIDEILKFREMIGQKSFWADLNQVKGAIFGLLYVWCHTKNVSEATTNIMLATCSEYDRRLAYIVVRD